MHSVKKFESASVCPLCLCVLKLRNYTVAMGPTCGQKKRLARKISVRVVREGRVLRTVGKGVSK